MLLHACNKSRHKQTYPIPYTRSMHKFMVKMGRQTLIHLLLACLLLMATQWHYSTFAVQAAESVHFRFKPAQRNSRSGKKFVFPARVDGKVHKKPSGPNPVGNHRPPSRK